jgi:hypothetical protein
VRMKSVVVRQPLVAGRWCVEGINESDEEIIIVAASRAPTYASPTPNIN